MLCSPRPLLAAALLVALSGTPALATWSVIAADTVTQEVVVASATCVTGIDLAEFSPVIVVGLGGGAAQSFVDVDGSRRNIIRDGLLAGDSSTEILAVLEALGNSAFHQHGIADTGGDSASGTGAQNGGHASGVIGQDGTLFYAIQGNVLTGSPVVTEAEVALLGAAGDLPTRVMAAMEAARAHGGDGRCSCSPGNPTGCGAPPPSFTKTADVGYFIVARFGDGDDPNCNASGCADGDYYLRLNVADQSAGDPDAVVQLQGLFDAFDLDRAGRPDGLTSPVTFSPLGNDYLLRLELRNFEGTPLGAPVVGGVTVEHAADSGMGTTIGPVTDLGDGTYEVLLTAGAVPAIDRFVITIDDGVRPAVVPPGLATLNPGDEVFGDGLESGDTTAWDFTQP